MEGYYKQEAATKETIRDGWIHTRDMGWLDEDGYLFLAGRKSDMIIRGGENIAPEEIEHVLHTNPDIEECAVIGVPDLEWGERVMAIARATTPITNNRVPAAAVDASGAPYMS